METEISKCCGSKYLPPCPGGPDTALEACKQEGGRGMWTALGAPGSRAQRLFKKPGLGRTLGKAGGETHSCPRGGSGMCN